MNGTPAASEPKSVQSFAPEPHRKRSPIQQAADLTIKAMLQQGTSIRKIAEALNMSPTTVARVKARLCTNAPDAEDLKSELLSPQRDNKLGKVIDHFLDAGVKLKKIKGSDVMSAGKLYADRRWPVRSEAPPPAELFVHVDLNLFRPDPLDAAQDVTPTPTGSISEGGKTTGDEFINEIKDANVS